MIRASELVVLASVVLCASSALAAPQEGGESSPPPTEAAPPAATEPAPAPAPEQSPDGAAPAAPASEVAEPAIEAARGASDTPVEEMVITGTHVKSKSVTTAAPVTVLKKADLEKAGVQSVGDILKALPSQSNAMNTQVNNAGDGSTRISLRGIGEGRTLVLVNGRRMVPGGLGADSSVDLNAIPISVVDRVEVLKDGASAIYGSDAIGGVVNIITVKSFEGATVTGYAGTSTRGDGQVYDLSFMTGVASEKGFITVSGNYFDQRPIWAGDRDYSKVDREYDFAPLCDTNGEPEGCYDPSAVPSRVSDGGSVGTLGGTIIDLEEDCIAFDADGVCTQYATSRWDTEVRNGTCTSGFCYYDAAAGVWRDFNENGDDTPGTDRYNYQPDNYLSTPQQRYSLFTTGQYNFTDKVRGFMQGGYMNRQSSQRLAPTPLFTFPDLVVSSSNRYNEYGRDFAWLGRRVTEAGPRAFEQDLDIFHLVLGVEGDLPNVATFTNTHWDVAFNYGRTSGTNINTGNFNLTRMARALGPDADCTGDCVPLDVMHGAGTITPEMLKYISFKGIDYGWNEMRSVAANLGTNVYELAEGHPIGVALGGEYRYLNGGYIPDPLTSTGETTGNKQEPTQGSYDVTEGYLELSVPVVAGMTGAELVELSLATRASHYSSFGDALTYKMGGRWAPVKGVTVRGTYSTAFRAPSISELYSGNSDSFQEVTDPCNAGDRTANATTNCAADGLADTFNDPNTQLNARVGGNDQLDAETAKTFTAGVVFDMVKNLAVTLDYWNMEIESTIASIGAGIILSECYNNAPGSRQYCDLINRDPASGLIDTITDVSQNIGALKTSGIDLGVGYKHGTSVGKFGVNLDVTRLLTHVETLADGYEWDAMGVYDLGLFPDWKAETTITWALEAANAGMSARWTSGGFEECAEDNLCNARRDAGTPAPMGRAIDANMVFDLFAGYTIDSFVGTTDLAVGVNNVLDTAPPVIYTGFYADSDPDYDFLGRFVYARLTQRL